MYAIFENYLQKYFGYLRKNLYICSLKSLGNNKDLR